MPLKSHKKGGGEEESLNTRGEEEGHIQEDIVKDKKTEEMEKIDKLAVREGKKIKETKTFHTHTHIFKQTNIHTHKQTRIKTSVCVFRGGWGNYGYISVRQPVLT